MLQNIEKRKEARQLLLQRITETLKADDRFIAAWLVGSLGRQGGDGLSDIDISVVVDAQHFPELCQRPWVVAGRTTDVRLKLFQQFGEPVVIHENNNNVAGNGTFTSVTYRADALTVDWTLLAGENVIQPAFRLPLFSKVEFRSQKPNLQQSQQERAVVVSEKVAFFWMMTTIAVKYMLRQDIVYFHMLLDGLHRTLIEVSYLVEGRSWVYQSGSQVKLAISRREQQTAIKAIATQMQDLMPKVVALGGYLPPNATFAVDYLLELDPIDDRHSPNALEYITEADRDKVRRFVEALNGYIGKRIGMYIGGNNPVFFNHFLNGFHAAAAILGLNRNTDGFRRMYEKVVIERGWRYTSAHPYQQMQERGMDNDAIIQEMIALESETWKRTYNITD
jgi:predicted nucleotidyltransferase